MNTLRIRSSAIGVLLLLAIGTAPAFAQLPSPVTSLLDGPAKWDAAMFLPTGTVNDALGKAVGTALKIPVDILPDFQLVLTKAVVLSDFGSARIILAFSAGLPETPAIATLEASGTFQFVEFTRGATDENPQVTFRVALDTLEPSAQIADKNFSTGDLIAKLRDQHILELISEFLVFSIPVPLDLAGEAHFKDDLTFAAGSGKVSVHVEAAGGRVQKKVVSIEPVFIPRGFWLCASYGPGEYSTMQNEGTESKDRLETYQEAAKDDTGRLLVRGAFIANMLDTLGDASQDARTATITGAGHEGKLIDGKASVWLQNDNENAKLTVEPRATWATDSGLKVTCSYKAETNADLAFNFKLPIGSVGSSVGCVGTSEGQGGDAPQAQIISTLVERPPLAPATFKASAFILMPVFIKGTQLETLRLHVETNGTFKTKLPFGQWFASDAPKVEVDATLPVPPDILPRLPLLTNEPRPIDFAKSAVLPKGVVLVPPKNGFPTHAVLEPIAGDTTAEGYTFDFKLSLETLKPEQVEERKAAITAMLHDTARPKLTVGEINVKVAGFGKGNDLIKALVAIGEEVGKAYEAGKKVAENTAETAKKAAEDFAREGEKVVESGSKEFSIAARNSEVTLGKGGRDTERALGKAAGDTVAAVNKGKNDFVNTADKARKDVAVAAAQAVQDAGTVLGKLGGAVSGAAQKVGNAAKKLDPRKW